MHLARSTPTTSMLLLLLLLLCGSRSLLLASLSRACVCMCVCGVHIRAHWNAHKCDFRASGVISFFLLFFAPSYFPPSIFCLLRSRPLSAPRAPLVPYCWHIRLFCALLVDSSVCACCTHLARIDSYRFESSDDRRTPKTLGDLDKRKGNSKPKHIHRIAKVRVSGAAVLLLLAWLACVAIGRVR